MTAIIKTESVPVDSIGLRPEGKNPRRRDSLEPIKESLTTYGQFKPVVVNARTNEVLAGNHTLKAARELGWSEIMVSFIDVDESVADAIVVADNRVGDMGTYDADVLADVLASLDDITGTGFTEQDLANIMAVQADDPVTQTALLEILSPPLPTLKGAVWVDGDDEEKDVVHVREYDRSKSRDPKALMDSLEDFPEELERVLQLRDSIQFPIENQWGIPTLRDDMLVDSLPPDLVTWAGKTVTPDPGGDQWFLYNYGVDSASELPWSRTVLGFYAYDHYIERWWRFPAKQVSRAINAGLRRAITPNFSLYVGDPMAIQLYNLYRSRWLGRYMQEAGIEVVPDVASPDVDSLDWVLTGVPDESPLSFQLQTVHGDDELGESMAVINESIARIRPRWVVVYAGEVGARELAEHDLGVPTTILMNRSAVRRGLTFGGTGYDR